MRDASSVHVTDPTSWRVLYRCEDLKQARAVATSIAAMEFDVRLCSVSPAAGIEHDDIDESDDQPAPQAGVSRFGMPALHGCGPACCRASVPLDNLPGPFAIEVPEGVWPQLAPVLNEIIAEQREFDEALEWRRDRQRTTLVIVLSVSTAAEVLLIWRLLES